MRSSLVQEASSPQTTPQPAEAPWLPVTLGEIQELQAKFAKDRDWDQFHSPRNLLLALVCPFNFSDWSL